MASLSQSLRGLVYSATELRLEHPEWSQEFIEDYLNILNNLITLADEIDTKGDFLENITVVNSSPYTPTSTDQTIRCDTTFSQIIINLPAGIDGTVYTIENIGNSGNDVVYGPVVGETLFGVSGSENLYDAESIVVKFKESTGWW